MRSPCRASARTVDALVPPVTSIGPYAARHRSLSGRSACSVSFPVPICSVRRGFSCPTSTRLTFAVLATGAGVFSMLQSLIAPALPTVQHALNTSQSTVTWVMTAYLLSASVFTPVLGRVGDLIGKKRTLVAVLVTVTLGCLLAALAPNIGVLIVARVVQGTGGALFPLSFGIIRDEFTAAEVGPSISNLSAVIAAGGGVGLVAACTSCPRSTTAGCSGCPSASSRSPR